MTKTQVMKELKAAGTEQNRKVYRRHGVQGEMFGVSYAVLGKLKKKIKADQALAEQLWATGNHDARVLATMIADPGATKAATLIAREDDGLPDDYFEKYIETIESTVHSSPNWARHAMNNALINIGVRNAALEKKATAAARRIGKIEVDHGQTGCKTPDAADYIKKTLKKKV